MIKTALFGVVFVASSAFAAPLVAVDNSFDCDGMINNLIGGANMSAMGGYDPILTVENGRARINKESKRIVNFKSDAKTVTITFKKEIIVNGKTETVKETVKYEVNNEGYLLNYDNDKNAVVKFDPMRRYGTRTKLKKDGSGNCAIDQVSTMLGTPDGSTAEVVNQDKKFWIQLRTS